MQPAPPRDPKGPAQALGPATASPAFAALVDRARRLDRLDRALRDTLPKSLAEQCRLANVRGTRLVFLASSPAVASRLRLSQTALLDIANQVTGRRFGELAVKVAPIRSVPPEPEPRKPLSPAAAAQIGASSAFLSDPELRDLFLRLASLASDASDST